MKNTLILIYMFISVNLLWGQSLCPPNGITTNPDAPNNPQNTAMENDFFDWRSESFNNYFDPNFLTAVEPLFSETNPYWSPEDYLSYLSNWEGTGNLTNPDVD